ncbi:hypothetical protein [Nocardia sp. NPDC005998]
MTMPVTPMPQSGAAGNRANTVVTTDLAGRRNGHAAERDQLEAGKRRSAP